MNSIENFQYFCEENKINIENRYVSSFKDKVRVGCFTCSNFFECQVQYIFSSTSKNTEPKCKKCRRSCKEDDCSTLPTFNLEGEKTALYCVKHKKEGMVDIKNPSCREDDCSTRPTYNLEGEKTALYCAKHKKEGMVDIKHPSCREEGCSTRPNYKYEGYCLYCFINNFPDKPVSRNYKTKEKEVVDRVMDRYSGLTWIWDKRIQDGCSRRRPDLLVDLGTHILIIEVDEQAHSDYNCFCENIRLHEICSDTGYRPVIIIRFNPDSYESIEGEKIKSCWTINKLGICTIPKKKQREWSERILTLFRAIEYWIVNIPYSEFPIGDGQSLVLEIVELFFS